MRRALLGLLLAIPLEAQAFFCTVAVCADPDAPSCTRPRPTQVWQQRCIPFYLSTSGTLFDSEAREQLVINSFAQWSGQACTDLSFQYMGRTADTDEWLPMQPAANKNVIAAVDSGYEPFEEQSGLLALTTTRYSVATGEIFDADIIVNTGDHLFDDISDAVACRNTTDAFDLRSVLVHEMGHFIGFDHTDIESATMFASADTCEVVKRDLDTDDQLAVCTVYPAGDDAHTCTPPESYTPNGSDPSAFRNQCDRTSDEIIEPGGCSCGTSPTDTSALVALLACAWTVGRRRRAAA